MTYERWAVYSAKDHVNLSSLIVDLILYDRIVFPVPSTDKVRLKWVDKGWKPDLQKSRIDKIGKSICVSRIWDDNMINLHTEKIRELANNRNQLTTFKFFPQNDDVKNNNFHLEDGYGYELLSLAASADLLSDREAINYKLPKGVNDFDLISPYHSKGELDDNIKISNEKSIGEFGVLLESNIILPEQLNEEKTLDEVLELVHDKEFKELRQNFYQWQKKLFKTNYTPREIINELDPGINDLNNKIKSKFKRNIFRSIFTIGGVGVSVLGTGLNPLAIAGGAICLANLALVDNDKISSIVDDSPFAVFYDLEKKTNIKLF